MDGYCTSVVVVLFCFVSINIDVSTGVGAESLRRRPGGSRVFGLQFSLANHLVSTWLAGACRRGQTPKLFHRAPRATLVAASRPLSERSGACSFLIESSARSSAKPKFILRVFPPFLREDVEYLQLQYLKHTICTRQATAHSIKIKNWND